MIRIGTDTGAVKLRPDVITQTIGVLAMRGAGKSNLAAVLAEGMFDAELPFVVVDPVGAWWGLRSSADGKSEGLPIPIFGGRRGDVPLERTGGHLIADLVVDERLTCVLDLTEFSETDKTRFLIDFAERLFKRNEAPLHLFLEEADDYIPQRPMREQARMLGAFERIVRRGRSRGLGMTMITQRSAALNKSVLTQIETLFVLRTTSPQDRKAIEGWVEYHGQKKELLASLPELATGEAWVWSPQWLGVLSRTKTQRRRTFDSGATPKMVKAGKAVTTLAGVDLEAVRSKMAETIERAKKDDPRELRRRVAELEKQLSYRAVPAGPAATEKRVEVPVLKDSQIARLEAAVEKAEMKLTLVQNAILQHVFELREDLRKFKAPPAPVRATACPPPRTEPRAVKPLARMAQAAAASNGSSHLPVGQHRILTAIAQFPEGSDRTRISVLSGLRKSTRDRYIQYLASAGLIDTSTPQIRATQAGIEALGSSFEPLPTGEALQRYWLDELPAGQRLILEAVILAYPKPLDRSVLSDMTGLQKSTRDRYLQYLQAAKVVTVPGAALVRAADELF